MSAKEEEIISNKKIQLPYTNNDDNLANHSFDEYNFNMQQRTRMARRRHSLQQAVANKKMKRRNFCHNILIFMAGTICALLCYELTHIGPLGSLFMRARSKQKLQHLPAESVLQSRDDSALYSIMEEVHLHAMEYGTAVVKSQVNGEHQDAETNIKEALGALRQAQEMRFTGKDEKAQRLYEHAYALAPRNPEVLLRYGEYLEHNNDVVLADQYYQQALTINPSSTEALTNRQRTANIVQDIDEQRLQRLDGKRDALSAVHESNAALRRAKKEAYFQHIYHSVGIEGNTMTLAQTRQILETRMAVEGKSVDEHNEILGLDAAMKFINATLVNKLEITLKDILDIHRRVLGHVDPIEGGEFRRTQVYVGGHVPPGPGDLSILMQRFELWLNSDQTISLHPVKHAALAHYKLVHIHPFVDGNGRTSRVLMNTLLMRAGYPPVIIPKQQRHKYYHYLQVANEGDIRPFVRFIADCTERTLDLYLWATSVLPQQIPMLVDTEHQLANVDKLLYTHTTTSKEETTSYMESSTIINDYVNSGSGDIP